MRLQSLFTLAALFSPAARAVYLTRELDAANADTNANSDAAADDISAFATPPIAAEKRRPSTDRLVQHVSLALQTADHRLAPSVLAPELPADATPARPAVERFLIGPGTENSVRFSVAGDPDADADLHFFLVPVFTTRETIRGFFPGVDVEFEDGDGVEHAGADSQDSDDATASHQVLDAFPPAHIQHQVTAREHAWSAQRASFLSFRQRTPRVEYAATLYMRTLHRFVTTNPEYTYSRLLVRIAADYAQPRVVVLQRVVFKLEIGMPAAVVPLLKGERESVVQVQDPPQGTDPDAARACVICLEPIPAEPSARLMSCDHIFHQSCLEHWFVRSVSCPTCRSGVRCWIGPYVPFLPELAMCDVESSEVYCPDPSRVSFPRTLSAMRDEIAALKARSRRHDDVWDLTQDSLIDVGTPGEIARRCIRGIAGRVSRAVSSVRDGDVAPRQAAAAALNELKAIGEKLSSNLRG